MKKALSLILALVMALSLTVPAFAADGDKSGTTPLTAIKETPFSYEIVIPTDVAAITAAGVYEVGQAKVENVVSATDDIVIFYTAATTNFKLSTDDSKTMAATYYTEEAATNAFPTTAVRVYEHKAGAESIPTMYVKITEDDWNAAAGGTYNATVTFNFVSGKPIPAGGEYFVGGAFIVLSGDAGDVFPETPAEGDNYSFGDYVYFWEGDGWRVLARMRNITECGAIPDSILGKPITSLAGCFQDKPYLLTAPEIPASVTDMTNCFLQCESLVTAPKIPAGVTNLSHCFECCSQLAGTIEINAQNLTAYDGCFDGVGSITLTGSCPLLSDIADSFGLVVGSN